MELTALQEKLHEGNVGRKMYELMAELYPICRSITGNGVRETLKIISRYIPLEIHEVPTGTPVFDWTVPKEWNIRDGYIKNRRGERVVDFQKSNLHILGYSVPIHGRFTLAELKNHLFTLPEFPEWIPYRTSYYKEQWGFCLSQKKMEDFEAGEYEVCIDSSLENGFLTYGEYLIPGETQEEILFSIHICHPSLCNDNLSGIALSTVLAQKLAEVPNRYSYRFLFLPGTIGSIAWLSRNEDCVPRIKNGLVIACVGDSGKFTYKKSRRGNAEIDRVVMHVLGHSGKQFNILDFSPYGYDERQFCSPGFNLPIGCFMRTPYGRFPEYHTSADDMSFVRSDYLEESYTICLSIIQLLEKNRLFMNRNPKCEPQLGKRGLYEPVGGLNDQKAHQLAMLWVLNLSDGRYSLLDIAERSGIKFEILSGAADLLLHNGLLEERAV